MRWLIPGRLMGRPSVYPPLYLGVCATMAPVCKGAGGVVECKGPSPTKVHMRYMGGQSHTDSAHLTDRVLGEASQSSRWVPNSRINITSISGTFVAWVWGSKCYNFTLLKIYGRQFTRNVFAWSWGDHFQDKKYSRSEHECDSTEQPLLACNSRINGFLSRATDYVTDQACIWTLSVVYFTFPQLCLIIN